MKEKIYSFILTVYVYSLISVAYASDPGFVFNSIGLKQGLSESSVTDIIEDTDGYMWFCTEDGLNRYNGYKFTVFRNNPENRFSLSNNDVRSLFLDHQGRLWVGTFQGLNIFDPATNKFHNYRTKSYKALNSITSNIEVITQDQKGMMWIGGEEGLFRISQLHQQPEHYPVPWTNGANHIRCITPDSEGNIWVGTVDGLLHFNTVTKQFTDYRQQYGSGYLVNTIFLDANTNLWLATSKGLKMIDRIHGSITEYHHRKGAAPESTISGEDVSDLISYDRDNLLLSIDGAGIDLFHLETKKFTHYSHENESQLSCNNITDLYLDSRKDLWVGTFLHGINYSNNTSNLFHFRSNNINTNTDITKGIVTSFLEDPEGNKWYTSDGGGLYCQRKGETLISNINTETEPSLSTNIALHLALLGKYVYISTFDGGLNCLDITSNKMLKYKNNPRDSSSISSDRLGPLIDFDNKIWIAADGKGIDVYDPQTRQFTHHYADKYHPEKLPSAWINCFLKDSQGNLWIGTTEGLCKYIVSGNSFKTYSFSAVTGKKNIDAITDIIEDKFGNFWVGTRGCGIVKFCEEKGTIINYSTAEGLPGNNIRILASDLSGNIWAATNNGLARVNIRNSEIKAFSSKEGNAFHPFYQRSKFVDAQGKIYFGCSGGYLIVNPALTIKNTEIPNVVFSKFILEEYKTAKIKKDSIIELGKNPQMHLKYSQNAFSIEFAALNYNSPEENKYSYFLEGFDNAWSPPSTQRFVSYTNLNPGTYTFRVKASNNDGVWNEEGTSMSIHINAPFWKKWWFVALELEALLLLLYTVYKWRLRNIKVRNKELEDMVTERTHELQESNNQLEAFVYKASHDIKGPLKSIIGLTTIGKKDVEGNPVAINYFNHILKSTLKLDKLLAEILDLTKIKQADVQIQRIDLEVLLKETIDNLKDQENFNKVKINYSIEPNIYCYSDRTLLLTIIQNLIQNSIKYSDQNKEKSFLDIKCLITESKIQVEFRDNGIGFSEGLHDKVFEMFFKVNSASEGSGLGLYIVKSSVAKLSGKIKVSSVEGEGTTIQLSLNNELEAVPVAQTESKAERLMVQVKPYIRYDQ